MVDDASAGEQLNDFGRETFEVGQDLERMIEQMDNISVKLAWMAYDMVVLRTAPQLAKSPRRLEREWSRCKAVVCGSGGNLMEKMEMSTDIVRPASTVDLDYILMQLDVLSETLDQLEVKTQLLQCHLTICFTHPNRVACLQSGPEDSTGLVASAEMAE